MPELAVKNECCGCGACYNACPYGCITMEPDYTGFAYPRVSGELCVGCGLCERACPSINAKEHKKCTAGPHYYAARNKDESVLRESTSGGAFTALAASVIENGGVVFGAVLGEDYSVYHRSAEELGDLKHFRGSKYVQSDVRDTFREARDCLISGKSVLYSGTPCQLAGLKQFLGKDYPDLICVDVMCRAVPSPKVFRKYIDLAETRFDSISRFVFRDKGKGYSYSTLAIYGKSRNKEKVYRRGKESDEWLRLFFGGRCNRPSCSSCKYQYGVRSADITMWDCFRVYSLAAELDNNKGATSLIAWNERAARLIDSARSRLLVKELPFDTEMRNLYREGAVYNEDNQFYDDLDTLTTEEFFAKYAPDNIPNRFRHIVRNAMYSVGIYDSVRRTIHRIRDSRVKK